jgi:hypothetical protein
VYPSRCKVNEQEEAEMQKVTIWGVGTAEMTEREADMYFGRDEDACPPSRKFRELPETETAYWFEADGGVISVPKS